MISQRRVIPSFRRLKDSATDWHSTILPRRCCEKAAIGTILIRRTEVRPFSDKQIALLKTFADQAVIAIENVRLFKELKSATQIYEAWSSRRRPARSCGVIASSPTDIQPVLEAVAESAARLCDAPMRRSVSSKERDIDARANYGSAPSCSDRIRPIDQPPIPWRRAMLDRRPSTSPILRAKRLNFRNLGEAHEIGIRTS